MVRRSRTWGGVRYGIIGGSLIASAWGGPLNVAVAAAADCAELEAAIPKYRQCVVEAEAAVRKLGGSKSQVVPGGGSGGPGMAEQYQQMAATCRAAEARARTLLQECRAWRSSARPSGAGGGGVSPNSGRGANPLDETMRQAQRLAELMRTRFDGAGTVEQLAELAREIETLRAAARDASGGVTSPGSEVDFGLPSGSLYDLAPDEAAEDQPLRLDGSRLCTEIEFFPDGTSRGSPPGCGGQGVLPEMVFPGPPGPARDAFHETRVQQVIEEYEAVVDEWLSRTEIAGVGLQRDLDTSREAPPSAPDLRSGGTEPANVADGIENDEPARDADTPTDAGASAPWRIIDEPPTIDDVNEAIADELPAGHAVHYRFNRENLDCVSGKLDGVLADAAEGPEDCSNFQPSAARAIQDTLLPQWLTDERINPWKCRIFSCPPVPSPVVLD